MESGMDDGIRFSLVGHAHNASTGVSSFDFHSVDLNAYLYKASAKHRRRRSRGHRRSRSTV